MPDEEQDTQPTPAQEAYKHIHLPIEPSDYITHSFHVKERTFVVTFQKRTFEISWAEGGTLGYREVEFTEQKASQEKQTPRQRSVVLYAAARVIPTEACTTFFHDLYNNYYAWAEIRGLVIARPNVFSLMLRKLYPSMQIISSVDGRLTNISFLTAEPYDASQSKPYLGEGDQSATL